MYKGIDSWTREHEKEAYLFLRKLISLPSTSTHEKEVIEAIKEEMNLLGYDEIKIDAMGNIMGRVGNGEKTIAFDGHIDTVGEGVIENWTFDPFIGKEDEQYIYGRGASDQTGGFVSALFGVAMLKDLNLLSGLTVWVVGTVQEEDCDGLCWQHILNEKLLSPEIVVLTEPTSLGVYRGHRGRMEIEVAVKGVSSHGSAPERGINAIYLMSDIIGELKVLNEKLRSDAFLGKGTLTVSEIFYTSPSRCAVADGCSISIDRRLTLGETPESAIEEIKHLSSIKSSGATVKAYRYSSPSYTGLVQDVPCEFPTWMVPEDHKSVRAMRFAFTEITERLPVVDKWTFSTNGVSIMGVNGIPCVGFGPGDEVEAHAPNEKIRKSDIITAIGVYALFAVKYKEV